MGASPSSADVTQTAAIQRPTLDLQLLLFLFLCVLQFSSKLLDDLLYGTLG